MKPLLSMYVRITALPKSSSADSCPVVLSTVFCSRFCQLLPKELSVYKGKRGEETISRYALSNTAGYQEGRGLPQELLYSRP